MNRQFNPEEAITTILAEQDTMVEPKFDLGDEDLNREIRDRINKRLEEGDVWAWASVTVRVTWAGFTGNAYLGGCNYADEADFRENGHFKDMQQEAAQDLLTNIKDAGWEIAEEAPGCWVFL
jgi:hypothetical protein